jgi:hypothetical protein
MPGVGTKSNSDAPPDSCWTRRVPPFCRTRPRRATPASGPGSPTFNPGRGVQPNPAARRSAAAVRALPQPGRHRTAEEIVPESTEFMHHSLGEDTAKSCRRRICEPHRNRVESSLPTNAGASFREAQSAAPSGAESGADCVRTGRIWRPSNERTQPDSHEIRWVPLRDCKQSTPGRIRTSNPRFRRPEFGRNLPLRHMP